MKSMFNIYTGDTGELHTNNNYINFSYMNGTCHILFSVTRQGNAACCHFTSNKAGLRKLEQALNDWCEFCFWLFDWCEMVIGIIERISVSKLAEKCNFKYVASFGKKQVYVRRPVWVE